MKKPKKTKHIAKKQPKRYDTDKLQSKETSKKCSSIIGEGFSNILDEDDEMTPYEFYIELKKIVNIAAEKEIEHKRHNEIPCLSSEVKYLYARRRSAKIMMLQNQFNEKYTNNYRELNKIVKAEAQKQNNDNLSEKISEMDNKKNSTHKLFKQVRELEGKIYRSILAMKNSQCNLKTKNKMYCISGKRTLRNTSTQNSNTTKMLCKNLTQ